MSLNYVNKMIPISIICPVYNEKTHIAACIESVWSCDYPKDLMEIIFVDGMSRDGTREIIDEYQQTIPQIRLIDNPKQTVSPALNMGIKAAQGTYIFRIDAHAQYPKNYFSVLLQYMIELKADNVGAVCRTLPADSSAVSTAIATVLSSSFGMGNSYFRIGSKEIRQTDTVPFGCFHKSLFEKIGYFDEELIRNQDDEFNGRIIKNGGKIFLIPFVEVNYYGRDTLSKTSKMFYQYGLFKPLVNKKLGTPATLRQFVPPLFVATLILTPLLLWILPSLGAVFCSAMALYLILNFGISLYEATQLKRFSVFLLLPVTFFIVHVSYGWGYLTGMVKILRKQPFTVQINR